MIARPSSGGSARPANLRDANGLGFLHRERARFFAGPSALLGVTLEPAPGDGVTIDATGIAELFGGDLASGGGVTLGAFASLRAASSVAPSVVLPESNEVQARLRLALLDARVVILGLGRNRTVSIDALDLKPYELPATIEVAAPKPGFGMAERRRVTNDGDASHAVGVSVALRISVLGRFEGVRIVADVDGALVRARAAEAHLDRQRVQPESVQEASRHIGAAIEASDARTAATARTLVALGFAALREAAAAARASMAVPDAPPRGVGRRR